MNIPSGQNNNIFTRKHLPNACIDSERDVCA
jgi:hypothetical protein